MNTAPFSGGECTQMALLSKVPPVGTPCPTPTHP